jgi:hypothetical protein
LVTYLVLYADLTDLTDAEADALTDDAAALDIDVQDLPTDMSLTLGVAVLVSAALGGITARPGERAGEALWNLIGRLLKRRGQASAVEDRPTGVTFIWTEDAINDGAVATSAMLRVHRVAAAVPPGTVLHWHGAAKQWRPARPPTAQSR